MAQTRPSHESEAYREALLRSVGPGSYMTAHDAVSRHVAVDGMVVTPRKTLVDVDSEMLGITRRLGACVASQYRPGARDGARDGDRDGDRSVHSDVVVVDHGRRGEDCRLSNPPCTLRGQGINRWEWLCQDPQITAISPFGAPVNYRNVAKDNHRPVIPCHIDASASLPTTTAADPTWMDARRDIEDAVASLPDRPETVHWRDSGEVMRIFGAF